MHCRASSRTAIVFHDADGTTLALGTVGRGSLAAWLAGMLTAHVGGHFAAAPAPPLPAPMRQPHAAARSAPRTGLTQAGGGNGRSGAAGAKEDGVWS